jgi:hypothetical protein
MVHQVMAVPGLMIMIIVLNRFKNAARRFLVLRSSILPFRVSLRLNPGFRDLYFGFRLACSARGLF